MKIGIKSCAVLSIATGFLHLATISGAAAQALPTPIEVVPSKRVDLPRDVDPQSRSRLPLVRRDDLDEAGKRAYDAVVDPNSRLRAELVGPAGIWLHVPDLSPHIREINWYLRNRIGLDPALT